MDASKEPAASILAAPGLIASPGRVARERPKSTRAVVGRTLQAPAEQCAGRATAGAESTELWDAWP